MIFGKIFCFIDFLQMLTVGLIGFLSTTAYEWDLGKLRGNWLLEAKVTRWLNLVASYVDLQTWLIICSSQDPYAHCTPTPENQIIESSGLKENFSVQLAGF